MRDSFKRELSEDKTELIFTKKDGIYEANAEIHVELGGCISVNSQMLDKNNQQIEFNFKTERVLFVDSKSNASSPDGLSWGRAFPTFDAALENLSFSREYLKNNYKLEIWITKGEYSMNSSEKGMKSKITGKVSIIGGFNGDEKLPLDIVDPSLTVIKNKDMNYSFNLHFIDVTGLYLNSDRVMKNLSIKCGCFVTNAIIYNCIIYDSFSYDSSYGAALQIFKNAKIKNCTIVKNGYKLMGSDVFPKYTATGVHSYSATNIVGHVPNNRKYNNMGKFYK